MMSADLQGNSVIAVKAVSVGKNASIVLQMEEPRKTCVRDVENVNVEQALVDKKLDRNAR